MQELIFKYPDKKPLFFGIPFANKMDAGVNQAWVSEFKNREWNAKIRVIKADLEITIYSTKELKHTYRIDNYNRTALKKFMRETRQNDKINFGHVLENKDGSHEIARTWVNNSVWVLPITKIEVLSAH